MVVDSFSQHHSLVIHIWHESVSDNLAHNSLASEEERRALEQKSRIY